jgi:predicted RNA-binding Zn-ribbon protein involved in translation (DUF1610 family)
MIQRQNKITDKEIIDSYNTHKHLGKMAAQFKLPTIEIWRKCRKLGLDFDNGGKNRPKIPLSEIFEGLHPYFQTGKVKKKILQENAIEYKCSKCNISEWNNKHLVLHLDHIDGDSSNHIKSNLRFLCPNCHSQTDTWCGRNK